MAEGKWFCLRGTAVLGAALAVFAAGAVPAAGQRLKTVIESRGKAFPSVGAGVMAIKRDAAGRYYILAKPQTVISVYSRVGEPAGQIPNAKSNGATIRFAVDMDFSPEGQLYVADRGANCILVFALDGTLEGRIPVTAPTSIVALSEGQVAVTSLTSKKLVQILDRHGYVVRSFGDVHDLVEEPEKQTLINLGKISGDSAGGIYFAFTAVQDHTLRKYDRYGYVGYEASVSEEMFAETEEKPDDRVEVSFGVSEFSFSDQASGWVTFGSSADMKFGGGLGTGLGESFGRGYGFGQAIRQQTAFGSGGAGYGGAVGAQFTGELTDDGAAFQPIFGKFSTGSGGGRGRGGAGGGNFSTDQGQGTQQGFALQFQSTGGNGSDSLDSMSFGQGTSILNTNAGTDAASYATGDLSSSYPLSGAPAGTDIGQEGLPSAFILSNWAGATAFGGPGRFGNFGGGGGFGRPPGMEEPHAGGGRGSGGGAGAGAGAYGEPHMGNRGHFGATTSTFTSRVRVNLGDLGGGGERLVITAMAADPETHEVWAAMGDALVRFSKDGDPVGMYYPTISGTTRLKPVAVLVEPDRILVAADPWGIFEFVRPDKPQGGARRQLTAAPTGNSSQN